MRRIGTRRTLFSLGVLTFLSGLALLVLGLSGQLGGSDSGAQIGPFSEFVSERPFEIPVQITPSPTPEPATAAATPATPTPPPAPPLGDAPYRMLIESIGADGPVQTFGLDKDGVPEVPTKANTTDPAKVIAWYNFSAKPGTGSNAVFAAHVTWFGRAIFYNLGKLKAGDKIQLKGDDGTELVYSVTDSFLVDPRDPNALQVMAGTPADVITLITCEGEFVRTGDPVFGGEYSNRRVVRAELVSVSAGR